MRGQFGRANGVTALTDNLPSPAALPLPPWTVPPTIFRLPPHTSVRRFPVHSSCATSRRTASLWPTSPGTLGSRSTRSGRAGVRCLRRLRGLDRAHAGWQGLLYGSSSSADSSHSVSQFSRLFFLRSTLSLASISDPLAVVGHSTVPSHLRFLLPHAHPGQVGQEKLLQEQLRAGYGRQQGR